MTPIAHAAPRVFISRPYTCRVRRHAPRRVVEVGVSAAVLHAAPVGVELVARDETGSNAACDRSKLALADQGADVLLGAAELESEVSNCQALRLLHSRSIAPDGTGAVNYRRLPSRGDVT